MTVKEAIRMYKNHQRVSVKEKTQKTYSYLFGRFEAQFGDRHLESIDPEELSRYLESLTEGLAKATRRLRYAQLKAFYNFIIENCVLGMKNPCNAPILSKSFRMPKRKARKILDKECVDEMIYNTKSDRDRLIMELQARCGLRIGEVLKLRAQDVSDRKLILHRERRRDCLYADTSGKAFDRLCESETAIASRQDLSDLLFDRPKHDQEKWGETPCKNIAPCDVVE